MLKGHVSIVKLINRLVLQTIHKLSNPILDWLATQTQECQKIGIVFVVWSLLWTMRKDSSWHFGCQTSKTQTVQWLNIYKVSQMTLLCPISYQVEAFPLLIQISANKIWVRFRLAFWKNQNILLSPKCKKLNSQAALRRRELNSQAAHRWIELNSQLALKFLKKIQKRMLNSKRFKENKPEKLILGQLMVALEIKRIKTIRWKTA